jgi:hypothetical protein
MPLSPPLGSLILRQVPESAVVSNQEGTPAGPLLWVSVDITIPQCVNLNLLTKVRLLRLIPQDPVFLGGFEEIEGTPGPVPAYRSPSGVLPLARAFCADLYQERRTPACVQAGKRARWLVATDSG